MALNWRPRRVRACRGFGPWGRLHPFRVTPGTSSNALWMPLCASRLAPGGRGEERRQGMSFLKLNWGIAGLLVLVFLSLGWAGQAALAASPFKGEYFVTQNQDPVCVPYTRNLNQFRRLDFDVCHPRLSEKYPQFTRPAWEEIPFDLSVAETIIMNLARRPAGSKDPFWETWLTASAPLRAEGKIKLWRTRIDIDGDGKPETMLRLDNPLSTKYWQGEMSWTVEEDACPYRHSTLYMLESPNDSMKNAFNHVAFALGGDIIHFPFPEHYCPAKVAHRSSNSW